MTSLSFIERRSVPSRQITHLIPIETETICIYSVLGMSHAILNSSESIIVVYVQTTNVSFAYFEQFIFLVKMRYCVNKSTDADTTLFVLCYLYSSSEIFRLPTYSTLNPIGTHY